MVKFDNVFAYSLAGGAALPTGSSNSALVTDLVSYWKLDESPGSDRVDSHGSNDLSEQGTVQSPVGIHGAAMTPNGSGNYLFRLPTSDLFGDVSFTISFWCYQDGVGTKALLESSNFRAFIVSNKLNFQIWTNPGNRTLTHSLTLALNFWYHFVLTHDAATKTFAIIINDGTPETNTYTLPTNQNPINFRVGNTTGSSASNVRIDELAFWKNRILEPADITTLYNGQAGLTYEDL